jgi:hypothetical protein
MFRILLTSEDPLTFELRTETNEVVQVGSNPRELSKWAFKNDADEVRHDYDLRKAEL